MATNAEITQRTIEEFVKIQQYMLYAKKENAVETYNRLKIDYIVLKATLTTLGVNLSEIDLIKE